MNDGMNDWLGKAERMGREEAARKMLVVGMSDEVITKATGLDDAAVQKLRVSVEAARAENSDAKGAGRPPLETLQCYWKLSKAIPIVESFAAWDVQPAQSLVEPLRNICDEVLEKYGGDLPKQIKAEAMDLSKQLILLDGILFLQAFQGEEEVLARLLQVITGKKNIKIEKLSMGLNYEVHGGGGRLALDCYTQDAAGNAYCLTPETDIREANDWNAIHRVALMRVEWESVGLGPEKPREVWAITLSSGDPKEKGQLLYHQTFGNDGGKPIIHMVYLSCSVARDLAQDIDARQSPQDNIELQRWQDLLQWGVNLGVQNANAVQGDDELKQCVSGIPDVTTEDGERALVEELLRWYGNAYTKGMEAVAKNMFRMGLSSISVAMATDLDDRTNCRLEDSLSA